MTSGKITKLQDNWMLVIGMIFVASTLRAPLTAVGPVINEIKEGLAIDNGLAGMLTTIPLIVFGLISPFVARIVERFSMTRVILYAMFLLIIGLSLRISGGIILFIIGTIILGIAIAFGNVTLPSYVKWKFPLQVGIVTGIYSATMNFTAGLGGGLSYPLSNSGGFRLSLGFWIVFCVIAIMVWFSQVQTKRSEDTYDLSIAASEAEKDTRTIKLTRSSLAWVVALTMGFQSMIFYTTVAWVPSILIHKGMHPEAAGYYLMLNQFAQVPMTFLFPIIASRMSNQRVLILIIATLYFAGFGLLLTGGFTALAMVVTGLAAGASFSICMTIFTLRARTSDGSIALSGFGQSVGYFIAAIGPFFIGYLHDFTHSWNTCIIAILIMCLMFMIFGLKATEDRLIEDEV